jgi:hypothetical protein
VNPVARAMVRGRANRAQRLDVVDDAQCASGYCIDGVCCNSPCRGTCETCGGETKGVCLPLQSGQDTNATVTCSGDFACFADPAKATASVCKLPDGKTCGSASQCRSGACTKFFVDGDLDGFGSGSKAQRSLCGTSAPAGLSLKDGDCNDSEAQVYPGQTKYFQTPIPGTQGYDYNCDNASEPEHPTSVFWRSGGFDSSNSIPECGGFRLREWEVQCNNRDECTGQCSIPSDRCVFPCVGCSNISGCDSQECNLGCERSGLCFFSPLNAVVYQLCR